MTSVVIPQLNIGVIGTVSGVSGLGTIQLPLQLQSLVATSLTSGTGANKVNQLFQTQTTLAASTAIDYDLYAYGAVKDAVGNAYTMATVKLLIIQNIGATIPLEADTLTIGGKGTTAGWTSAFGTNTDTIKLNTGGTFVLFDPGSVGYVVGASTTNHILTLTASASASPLTYNLIVVGATA